MHEKPNRLAELADDQGRRLSWIAARCGVNHSTVWRWSEGKTAIPDEQKVQLARLLGVTVEELMNWPADVSAAEREAA